MKSFTAVIERDPETGATVRLIRAAPKERSRTIEVRAGSKTKTVSAKLTRGGTRVEIEL